MLFCPHEAKLPAKEDEARPHSRFSCAPQNKDRQTRTTASNAQGSISSRTLMPRSASLTRADFARMKGFKRLMGAFFSLSWGKIEGRTTPASACVISAKTAPRAVVRNRIKRRCRATMAPLISRMDEPWILVWHAKKGAVHASNEEMKREIQELMSRAGITPHEKIVS